MLRTLFVLVLVLGVFAGRAQTAICVSTTYRGAVVVYEDHYFSSDTLLLRDLKQQTDARLAKGTTLPKTNYHFFPAADMAILAAYITERRDRMDAVALRYAVQQNASIYVVSIIDARDRANIVVRNAFREKDDAHAYFDQLLGWIQHDHAAAGMVAVFKGIMKTVE